MPDEQHLTERLSPWWRRAVILILILGFSVLIWVSVRSYKDAPPIPERVVSSAGAVLFTRSDILTGQQVFLKYGLMENGTIWGHGAYLGPDFSAKYLHTLAVYAAEFIAQQDFKRRLPQLTALERAAVNAEVSELLKQNRYHPENQTLTFTAAEEASYGQQIEKWRTYFENPLSNRGLMTKQVQDPEELRQLTAFFAWTAWASVANRPGKSTRTPTISLTTPWPAIGPAGRLSLERTEPHHPPCEARRSSSLPSASSTTSAGRAEADISTRDARRVLQPRAREQP